jgi:hypothetical protein
MDTDSTIKMSWVHFKKMTFIMNALEQGWSVKKEDDKYVFSKKHEGKREIFREDYLRTFIVSNMVLGQTV